MKKYALFLLALLATSSCSNDEKDYLLNDQLIANSQTVVMQDTTDVISIDSLFRLAVELQRNDPNYLFDKKENPPITKSAQSTFVGPITTFGYNTVSVRTGMENRKVMFPTSEYGLIANKVYIVDFCEARKTITLPSGALTVTGIPSPNCGFNPVTSQTRGCSSYQEGTTLYMTTNLTHVKYDALGMLIDKWVPVTPNNLEWVYAYIIP